MKNFFEDQLLKDYFIFERMMHQYFIWKREGIDADGIPLREQQRILSLLTMQSKMTKREIGFLLGIHPHQLNHLLQSLSDDGLIEVDAAESEMAGAEVVLTESGREKVEQMKEENKGSVFDILSDDEKEQFQHIIGKLSKELDEELPEEAKKFSHFHRHPRIEFEANFRRSGFHHHGCRKKDGKAMPNRQRPDFDDFGMFESNA